MYWSTHPKEEQNETEKCRFGVEWQQKGIRYSATKLDNKLSQNVQDIEKIMENWKVELTAWGKSLAEVKI